LNESLNVVGKCCSKESKFIAHYDNEPLENFAILLCSDHVLAEPYTKNVTKIIKIGEKT